MITVLESDLSTLFSTNRPPDSIEIASVEAQVHGLQQERIHLQARLDEIDKELGRRRGILSSLRRFPTEVLGEIFSIMTPAVLDDKGRQQLVDLQLVCRDWRDTARVVHQLWSGIQVKPCHRGAEVYGKVAKWLDRSGGVARTVHWSPEYKSDWSQSCSGPGGIHKPAGQCALVKSVLLRLLTEESKIDNLKLKCVYPDCFRYLLMAVQGSNGGTMPRSWRSIKSFAVEFNCGWIEWVDPLEPIYGPLLHLLPPVEELNIHLPNFQDIFPQSQNGHLSIVAVEQMFKAGVDIPCSILVNLTALTFTCGWAGSHLLDMLEHCKKLNSLTIDMNSSSFIPGGGNEYSTHGQRRISIVLPNLKSLRTRMMNELGILEYLTAPSLASIDIGIHDGDKERSILASWYATPLIKFIKQSCGHENLSYLRLSGFHADVLDLVMILSTLPFLTHLVMDRMHVDSSELFEQLVSCDPLCLPRLETLELLRLPHDFDVAAMLNFLEERESEAHCRVTLSYRPYYERRTRECDIQEALERAEVNATARILPPVDHRREGRRS